MGKRTIAALGAAAALTVAAGATYAAASGDGVVKACAGKVTGELRLQTGNACLPFENAVQWNQTGPQGPIGPAGPQGPTGPQGPAGATHADERFFYRGGADPANWLPVVVGTWPDVRPSMTHVLTMHLDPGNYAITVEVIGGNYSGVGVLVCLLGNPTVGYALGQTAIGNAAGYGIQQTMEEQSLFPLPQGGDLELSCFSAPQGDAPVGNPIVGLADVIATKIDTMTSTSQ
jgi:hypothetical protein